MNARAGVDVEPRSMTREAQKASGWVACMVCIALAACRPAQTTEAPPTSEGDESPSVAPPDTPEPPPPCEVRASENGLARLACDRLELARSVVFRHDWTIDSWSFPALEAAAEVLRSAPSSVRIRIEADDAWNDPNRGARVSASRADAVMRFLVANGADASRIEAEGFGEQRVTERSGAPRRVRFLVVDPPSSCARSDRAFPDADRDGIADASDRCPTEAEDYDGSEDADGCREATAGQASLDCRVLRVDEPIRFERDGRTLSASSRARVDSVATLLRDAAFVRVVIIHERVRHNPRRQEPLPQDRADAVRDALVRAGVSPDRLVARVDSVLEGPRFPHEITFEVYEQSIDCPPVE